MLTITQGLYSFKATHHFSGWNAGIDIANKDTGTQVLKIMADGRRFYAGFRLTVMIDDIIRRMIYLLDISHEKISRKYASFFIPLDILFLLPVYSQMLQFLYCRICRHVGQNYQWCSTRQLHFNGLRCLAHINTSDGSRNASRLKCHANAYLVFDDIGWEFYGDIIYASWCNDWPAWCFIESIVTPWYPINAFDFHSKSAYNNTVATQHCDYRLFILQRYNAMPVAIWLTVSFEISLWYYQVNLYASLP